MASVFDDVVAKVVEGAEIATDVAGQAARNAVALVKKSIDMTALNAKVKGISLAINKEFAQIGELVYQTHKNPDTSVEDLDDKLARIDGLYAEMDEAKAERDRRMNEE